MRRIFAIIGLAILTLLPTSAVLAYESNICKNATCTPGEVGIIMAGISDDCGNAGTCQLTDVMTVFANIGNWISGIIGAIVLMMYVIGGFYFLSSGGNQARITKGKEYIRISTVGMLIVMFAYIGIYMVRGVIQTGDAHLPDGNYVTCTDADTEGQPCELNSTCVNGACITECLQQYGNRQTETDLSITVYGCVDINADEDLLDDSYSIGGCIPNLCDGGANRQCCQIEVVK